MNIVMPCGKEFGISFVAVGDGVQNESFASQCIREKCSSWQELELIPSPSSPRNSALSRLPQPVKRFLLAIYWLGYDTRDFLAEAIGWLPSNRLRCFFWRGLGVRIGQRTSIHSNCRIYCPNRVQIASHTIVNRDVLLDGRMGLSIGSNVSISEGAMLLSLEHDPQSPTFAGRGAPTRIADYVFIGARAIILPGRIIGEGAVVATVEGVGEELVAGGAHRCGIHAEANLSAFTSQSRRPSAGVTRCPTGSVGQDGNRRS